jgi:hypothetical protein
MTFPFYPIGAVVAALIVIGALTLFVSALMAIDRTASRVTGTVVSSLVAGFRSWSPDQPERGIAAPANTSSAGGESDEAPPVAALERVRPVGP